MKTEATFVLLLILVPISLGAFSVPSAGASAVVNQNAEQLNIVVQPVSHLSGCVQMSIAARGDGIPFLMNVTYASTGKKMTNGTVQVYLHDRTLKARYSATSGIWSALYLVSWDHATGPLDYYVTAKSFDGAEGFWRPIEPYGLITIVPASLHSEVSVVEDKTSQPAYTASVGTVVRIIASVALPLPGQGYPTQVEEEPPQVDGAGRLLNATSASEVEAIIGQGTFNSTTRKFSNYTSPEVDLSYDAASSKWVGTYTFQQSDPEGQYQIVIVGADKSAPPNVGYSAPYSLTLGAQTSKGVDTSLIYVVSVGMIIIGFVAGLIVISKFALPKH